MKKNEQARVDQMHNNALANSHLLVAQLRLELQRGRMRNRTATEAVPQLLVLDILLS